MAKQPKTGSVPAPHVAGVAPGPPKKDPCKYKSHIKKKFVVYIAPVMAGNPPKPTGEMYVGRTRGEPSQSVEEITLGRMRGHHRRKTKKKRKKLKKIGGLIAVCVTDSYAAVRGAEQAHMEYYKRQNQGSGQMNGVSPDHPEKKNFEECAKQKNGPNCDICGGTA